MYKYKSATGTNKRQRVTIREDAPDARESRTSDGALIQWHTVHTHSRPHTHEMKIRYDYCT